MNQVMCVIRQNTLLPCAAFHWKCLPNKRRKTFFNYLMEQLNLMFKPAALFIGVRYTRAKRRNHFISFISLVSMIGIALGVAVLITVLSVMNGFDREIKNRVFSMVPPVTVSSVEGYVSGWQDLQKLLGSFPGVSATAPFATGEVLLNFGGSTQPGMVTGILPDQEGGVTELPEKIIQGNIDDLK